MEKMYLGKMNDTTFIRLIKKENPETGQVFYVNGYKYSYDALTVTFNNIAERRRRRWMKHVCDHVSWFGSYYNRL